MDIKGKKITSKTLHKLPKELDVFTITSKKEANVIGFFGELNALSNFHPAEFEVDGITFPTSEHYIQYTKARVFGDNLAAANILNASTPADSKSLGWSVNNFDKEKWDENAKRYCYQGIREKFMQNKQLLDTLLHTKGHILVESAKDKVWGTGIVLSRDDWHDESLWHSQGILGEMLCDIRDTYLNLHPDTVVQELVYPKKFIKPQHTAEASPRNSPVIESLQRSRSQPELATLAGVPLSMPSPLTKPTPTTGSTPNLSFSTPPCSQKAQTTNDYDGNRESRVDPELQGVPHELPRRFTYSREQNVVSGESTPNQGHPPEEMETMTSVPMNPTQAALVLLSQEGQKPI